jgi:hypothetical protein
MGQEIKKHTYGEYIVYIDVDTFMVLVLLYSKFTYLII